MKFVNEKTTEDFKVRESDNYEAVYDEQFQIGGLIVDGVLFTTLTLDQYKTLAITFKEKGFEDFFNSVGIGDEKLNLQPKAACYSDYERSTGEIQFKENKVETKKLTKARLKESIEFKKSIVYSVLQDPANLDDCVKSVAERTGLDETNAIDLIDEWMADSKLTESENPEYPVFVQINTDEDIDKWMAPIGCDIRSDYDISDVEGSYWEIIADDEDLYRKAIAEGAVTMSELDPETDTFIFLFGNPSRLSIEGLDGYISEMGLDPEDYGVDRCDWYYDNDDAEIQLDEEKLEEGKKLKALALGCLMSLAGMNALSAQSLKDKDDWNKSTSQVKKELVAEYGKDGKIPKEDLRKMFKACAKSYKEDGEWFFSEEDGQNVTADLLSKMGFKQAAEDAEKINIEFENLWDKYGIRENRGQQEEEKLEEGSGWKAALLAGLLAVSGLTGQAFAKDKAPKMTPEQKIEQLCQKLPKEISGDQFVEFRDAYMDALGYDKEDRMTVIAITRDARDALEKNGISQEGWKKNASGCWCSCW